MKIRFGALSAGLALATLGSVSPAAAAREFGRGNITAVDWNAMQIEIKTPQGGRLTYKVAKGCEVKFTDGAQDFPNPTLQDLAPPMYIHFQFEDQVISVIDVREVGGAPRRRSGAPSAAPDTAARELKVRILRLDERRGTFEADVAGRRQSFRAENARLLRDFGEGDLVVIELARRGGSEVVTDIRGAGQTGRVTTLDERRGEIGIEVRGRETLYRVDNDRILRGIRVGDRITFETEERGGRRVITRIE
jgi:Cu/Ag efflux protein CusF